jgi:hypothetical protein
VAIGTRIVRTHGYGEGGLVATLSRFRLRRRHPPHFQPAPVWPCRHPRADRPRGGRRGPSHGAAGRFGLYGARRKVGNRALAGPRGSNQHRVEEYGPQSDQAPGLATFGAGGRRSWRRERRCHRRKNEPSGLSRASLVLVVAFGFLTTFGETSGPSPGTGRSPISAVFRGRARSDGALAAIEPPVDGWDVIGRR